MKQALGKAGEATLLSVACLTIMVGCAIVPGLQRVSLQLGLSGLESWLVTMPSVGVVALGPIAGRIADRIGLRRALLLGLAMYGALGLGGALLHGPYAVLGSRFLLGGATALVMATGTGLISAFYADRQRLAMIARQGMAIELGGVAFLMLGGWLAVRGWWYPFLQYAVAWGLLVCVLRFVPDERTAAGAPHEAQSDAPLPDALKPIYCAAFLSMACFFSAVIVLPLRFHELGIGEAGTGYFLAFVSLVAVGVAAMMPRISSRLGAPVTLTIAFLAYAAAHGTFAGAASLAPFVAGAVALGAGFGLSIPLVNHMTVEASPANRRGRALGNLSMAIFAGQCLPSFMHYTPGHGAPLFGAAAGLALFAAAGLPVVRRVLGPVVSR
ncbi:MFS transporter [Burkholderia sp. Ac-20379]|uniref:MFS transporter n=1 Tax=Burkholderia sp. Ac-20379 TaxID=2703900 RepID=UPI00197DBDA2|nr:MFS transporter [Burkholderia sp. Ac-20379]MBN3728190.1 MFS transporter [Burkholderia sp. Ac-20379]